MVERGKNKLTTHEPRVISILKNIGEFSRPRPDQTRTRIKVKEFQQDISATFINYQMLCTVK